MKGLLCYKCAQSENVFRKLIWNILNIDSMQYVKTFYISQIQIIIIQRIIRECARQNILSLNK